MVGPDKPVPVQKIEIDLWVPEEFAYLSWSGNLKRSRQGHPTALSKLAHILRSPLALAGGDSPHPDPAGFGAKEAFDRETESKSLYSFSCMARTGTLGLSWTTPTLLVFTDVVLFFVVLIGGTILIRKLALNRLWAAFNFTWAPLVPAWFIDGPAAGPFSAAFYGGTLLLLVTILGSLRKSFTQWRLERMALAPDPYLEEAVAELEDAPSPKKPKKKARKAKKKSGKDRKES